MKKIEGLTFHLAFSVVTVAFGCGFQHGYNLSVMNSPAEVFKSWISVRHKGNYHQDISPQLLETIWWLISNIYCMGGIIGAVLSSQMLRTIGPRKALIYNNIILFAGCVLQSMAMYVKYYELIIIGRLIVGVNSGVNSGICTVYLCDASPLGIRGAVGSMYSVALDFSTAVSFVVGMEDFLGSEETWHYLLGVPMVPAVIQLLILVFFTPESPRFLFIIKEDREGAVEALKWYRGKDTNIEPELSGMDDELTQIKDSPHLTLRDFRQPYLQKPLLVVLTVMIIQQMSGFMTIEFFSSHIFTKEAGLNQRDMELANIGHAVVGTLSSILTMVFLIETYGRKPLILGSLGSMAVALQILLLCLVFVKDVIWMPYVAIASIYCFVFVYNIGLGCIPWFLASELLPQNAKPLGQSAALTMHWASVLVIALTFSPLNSVIGYYTFLIYIVCNLLSIVYVAFNVPETRNKTVEEVQMFFKKRYRLDGNP